MIEDGLHVDHPRKNLKDLNALVSTRLRAINDDLQIKRTQVELVAKKVENEC